jgi:ankyrin repeat protein
MSMAAPPALLTAIRAGDVAAVEAQLAADPALAGATGPTGESLVLHACYCGHANLVPVLGGHRPLDAWEASALGDLPQLEDALAAAPPSRDATSPDGWTPLHLAAFFGEDAAVALLLARGASPGARSANAQANTALHAAIAGAGSVDVVLRLLDAGADAAATAAQGITPLHLAAARGAELLVDVLLDRGADPRTATDDGRTPARLATERGFAPLGERLDAM